ncbi:MAG: protein-L-isoaspartate O-methyltransferase [Candidatus Micrarchaeota archaeon]|nr:protein-L-isoaspartate O-methyltransferase [Candidatus Micrarchaeota archaeon]MDE1824637.1 protein-L-isoaspartate O-methyltransferase [Candidatus Micrarchaeota archaeon]MDE1849702.1 protein-L-isoaspartate O-methyltransferase [Candidatus Micrarchaeota archaeon]
MNRDRAVLMKSLDKDNLRFIDFLVEMGFMRDVKIINAFKHVPRHLFVKDKDMDNAYRDTPLDICADSNITQPSTVALMLEHLDLNEGDKVLEIGTGSGWNAALIGYCVGSRGKVVSLEIEKSIATFASGNIIKAGIDNVDVLWKDGASGHMDMAPYDKVIYTAAVRAVPDIVLAQVKVGGMVLAPIGGKARQVLTRMEKIREVEFRKTELGRIEFRPLVGWGE